jgi:hypothetical protein
MDDSKSTSLRSNILPSLRQRKRGTSLPNPETKKKTRKMGAVHRPTIFQPAFPISDFTNMGMDEDVQEVFRGFIPSLEVLEFLPGKHDAMVDMPHQLDFPDPNFEAFILNFLHKQGSLSNENLSTPDVLQQVDSPKDKDNFLQNVPQQSNPPQHLHNKDMAMQRVLQPCNICQQSSPVVTKHLDDLPSEIIQTIGAMLPDVDIDNFKRTCKATKEALSDQHFWLMRFLTHLGEPIDMTRLELKSQAERMHKKWMSVLKGKTKFNYDTMLVLKQLIIGKQFQKLFLVT